MKKLILAIIILIAISAFTAKAVTLLSVPQGGTGAGTFTAGDVLQGNGTGAIQGSTLSGDATLAVGGALTIGANKILESHLKAVNGPTDEYVLTYEATTGDFEWEADQTGAGGSAIIFDIGDDGGNDSVDVSEIATSGDTNSIFTEPSADKILITLSNDWPKADTAEDLTCTDCVDDTNVDWGTGANQISSVDMPDHNGHTVRDTFVHTVNRGVAEAITVTLTGGLGVSWTTGEIYDRANHTFVATEVGSGNVTNNVLNYLKWVSGTTLTLSTVDATGDEVLVAIGSVYDGNINAYREMSLLDESIANIRRCARAVFPTRVTSGMSVYEDADATNPLDVTMDAGAYCKELQQRLTPVEIKSRTTAMVRHFHTGGVWDSDTNAQIETTNYDNGTNKTAIPANKYVKGLFIYMNGKIGFVYPTEYSTNIAQAQIAALPAMPPGLETVPKLTAVVYQQGVANFTGAIWQDVRAGISEESFAGVTDHGALAGLSDDDHSQYPLLVGRTSGQTLIGGTTTTADLTLQTTSGVGTTGADMHFLVGNAGATEAMTILNNGNVGIGTNAPGEALDVNGSIRITDGLDGIKLGTGAAQALIWQRFDGRIAFRPNAGVSTDFVDILVDDGNLVYEFQSAGDALFRGYGVGVQFETRGTGYGPITFAPNVDSIGVSMTILETNGNVGIGTTSPDTPLHIYDASATSDFYIESGGAGLGGRIIIEDTDGAGCTALTTLNGVLTAAIIACP